MADCLEAGQAKGPRLLEACNHFYTRIPHDFGMRAPPLIVSTEMVQLKLQLLEALGDIQVALKLLGSLQQGECARQLGVSLAPLGPGPELALIERSILSTHAATHSQYSMAVEQVFALDRAAELEGFLDCGNRRLLFHGSRLSNWAGILGQGLCIAPALF